MYKLELIENIEINTKTSLIATNVITAIRFRIF